MGSHPRSSTAGHSKAVRRPRMSGSTSSFLGVIGLRLPSTYSNSLHPSDVANRARLPSMSGTSTATDDSANTLSKANSLGVELPPITEHSESVAEHSASAMGHSHVRVVTESVDKLQPYYLADH